MNVEEMIDYFLLAPAFAVAGASSNRAKYGNKVLRCYLQAGRQAAPIHPSETEVEGVEAFASLSAWVESMSVPVEELAVSVITPPPVTERLLEQCGELGIRRVWLQPGAESETSIARAESLGIALIHSGPCLLVKLGYRETPRS